MFDYIEDEDLRNKAISEHEELIETINSSVDEKVNTAVNGLKSKNEELLGEKKKIQEALKNFDGVDPVKAKEAMKFLEENAEAQLIKDGKFDELVDKKTSQIRNDYETKLEEINEKLAESTTIGNNYKKRFESKMVDDAIREAAIAEGVLPDAVVDVLMRARSVFSLGEDGNTVEARTADGKLLKNSEKLIVTPSLFVRGLKDIAPHYWPASEGAGAHGKRGAMTDMQEKLNEAAKSNNIAEYRKIRAKMKKQS